mmetsp:Transcript_89454/g.239777  ORF Transcript_89454/g.239777 Transcript_89454/m.239777 type:complete len:700 (-) Transcript_89454:51-2150(-)
MSLGVPSPRRLISQISHISERRQSRTAERRGAVFSAAKSRATRAENDRETRGLVQSTIASHRSNPLKSLELISEEQRDLLLERGLYRRLIELVEHPYYDRFMNFLIVANAVSMGLEADSHLYHPTVATVLQDLEHVFLAFFTFELIVHVLLFRMSFVKSSWGAFDCIIVTFGVFDQWILPVVLTGNSQFNVVLTFRVLRLVRITRAVRLMSQFRVMWMLVRSLRGALVTLIWAVLLLCTIIYVFAIVAVEVVYKLSMKSIIAAADTDTAEIVERCFGTVAKSMFTLFQITTLDSWSPIVRPILFHHWYLIFFFGTFIGISAIAVMNLVTAIIVETSRETVFEDKAVMKKFLDQQAKHTLLEVTSILQETDLDGSGDVTKQELLKAYATNPAVRGKMDSVCDFAELVELFDFFDDEGDGALSFEELSGFFLDYKVNPVRTLQIRTLKRLADLEMSFNHLMTHVDADGAPLHRRSSPTASGTGAVSRTSSRHNSDLSSAPPPPRPPPLLKLRTRTPNFASVDINLCAKIESCISSEFARMRAELDTRLSTLEGRLFSRTRGVGCVRAASEDVDLAARLRDQRQLTRQGVVDSPKSSPRSLPASATFGPQRCVAGGVGAESKGFCQTPSTADCVNEPDNTFRQEFRQHRAPSSTIGEMDLPPDDSCPAVYPPRSGGTPQSGPGWESPAKAFAPQPCDDVLYS